MAYYLASAPESQRLLLAIISHITTADPNKSQYNLFNPTPRALMREMSTDRPAKTASAYAVDAGHDADFWRIARARITAASDP